MSQAPPARPHPSHPPGWPLWPARPLPSLQSPVAKRVPARPSKPVSRARPLRQCWSRRPLGGRPPPALPRSARRRRGRKVTPRLNLFRGMSRPARPLPARDRSRRRLPQWPEVKLPPRSRRRSAPRTRSGRRSASVWRWLLLQRLRPHPFVGGQLSPNRPPGTPSSRRPKAPAPVRRPRPLPGQGRACRPPRRAPMGPWRRRRSRAPFRWWLAPSPDRAERRPRRWFRPTPRVRPPRQNLPHPAPAPGLYRRKLDTAQIKAP
jgi:hypothetical protein